MTKGYIDGTLFITSNRRRVIFVLEQELKFNGATTASLSNYRDELEKLQVFDTVTYITPWRV